MRNEQVDLYINYLRKARCFADLMYEDLRQIAALCSEERFLRGDIVYARGEIVDRIYIVFSGTIEVWKNYAAAEQNLLAVNGSGALIGETALLGDIPQSATLRAQTDVAALAVRGDDFRALVSKNASVCLRILQSVLRKTSDLSDASVADIRRRNIELEAAYCDLKSAQADLLVNERLSVLGRFSSLILHDVRNPLSILKTRVEMLSMCREDAARFEECVSSAHAEIQRMESLVAELLDYARGEISLNMELCQVSDLIERVRVSVEEKLACAGIDFITDNKVDFPVILDKNRMIRVLINVVDNAFKASKRGGTVSLCAYSANNKKLIFEVRDTGVGMSAEVLERVFTPFYSNAAGGVGLGMLIVKSVIEAHGGTVSIDSIERQGTTVTLTVPLLC